MDHQGPRQLPPAQQKRLVGQLNHLLYQHLVKVGRAVAGAGRGRGGACMWKWAEAGGGSCTEPCRFRTQPSWVSRCGMRAC
jgi:hypothetical protein